MVRSSLGLYQLAEACICIAGQGSQKEAIPDLGKGIVSATQSPPTSSEKRQSLPRSEGMIPDSESPSSSRQLPASYSQAPEAIDTSKQGGSSIRRSTQGSLDGAISGSQSPVSLHEPAHRKEVHRHSDSAGATDHQAAEPAMKLSAAQPAGYGVGPDLRAESGLPLSQQGESANQSSQQEATTLATDRIMLGSSDPHNIAAAAAGATRQGVGDAAKQPGQDSSGGQAAEAADCSNEKGTQSERQVGGPAASSLGRKRETIIGSPSEGSRRKDSPWEDSQDGYIITLRRRPPTKVVATP